MQISPDGRWLAYISNESGQNEVYVRSLKGEAARYQVSSAGGAEPMWGVDGNKLFFRNGPFLFPATLATAPGFTVIRRDSLFAMDAAGGVVESNYGVTPDGNHFIIPRLKDGTNPPVVVFGWMDEVRESLAGEGKK